MSSRLSLRRYVPHRSKALTVDGVACSKPIALRQDWPSANSSAARLSTIKSASDSKRLKKRLRANSSTYTLVGAGRTSPREPSPDIPPRADADVWPFAYRTPAGDTACRTHSGGRWDAWFISSHSTIRRMKSDKLNSHPRYVLPAVLYELPPLLFPIRQLLPQLHDIYVPPVRVTSDPESRGDRSCPGSMEPKVEARVERCGRWRRGQTRLAGPPPLLGNVRVVG